MQLAPDLARRLATIGWRDDAPAAEALRNAGPEIEQSASDIKERAGRVADKVDNLDVDVDLNTADNKPARPTN